MEYLVKTSLAALPKTTCWNSDRFPILRFYATYVQRLELVLQKGVLMAPLSPLEEDKIDPLNLPVVQLEGSRTVNAVSMRRKLRDAHLSV